MKQYTIEELSCIVSQVMSEASSWEIKILKQTDKELLFEATHMYNWDEYKPTTKNILSFVEQFKTDKLDVYETIASEGCDTCDYGSSYGFALRVWE
jgi:hypothetical protein